MSRILLVAAGIVVAITHPSPAQAQGTAKLASPASGGSAASMLVCHGGPGIQVRIHADPSPSWVGPASFPAKPVRMAFRFAGGTSLAELADAGNLPAGSCAWIDWDSRSGGPPGEMYVDVNAAGRPDPNPASLGANLADAKRFYLFPTRLVGGEPIGSFRGEWIPRASSQAAGPATQPTTAAGIPILRQLMCRGGPSGLEFKVIANPSPAYPGTPRYVRLAIRYRPHLASDTAEMAFTSMSPGSCGWEMRFGAPKPSGEVLIDIQADAQASNAGLGIPRDTSASAALAYADTASLRRYLSDPSRFWIFYHLDRGEPLAVSHGAYKPDLTRLFAGSVRDARTTASGTRTTGATSSGATAAPPVAPTPTPTPAPAPSPTGNVGGALRDDPAPAAVAAGNRTLPTDSAARRTAAARTPTNSPTSGVEGPLRRPSPGTATPAAGPLRGTSPGGAQPPTSRATSKDTAAKIPDDARVSAPLHQANRVYDVKVAPGPLGVRLTFKATGTGGTSEFRGITVPSAATAGLVVQIQRTRPSWNERERQWYYPPGGPWFASVEVGREGGFVAEPRSDLENGELYYYLITVNGTDPASRPAQRTGSFRAYVRTPIGDLFKN